MVGAKDKWRADNRGLEITTGVGADYRELCF